MLIEMWSFMKRNRNKPEVQKSENSDENDVSDEFIKLIVEGETKREEIFGQKPRKKEDK